LTVAPENVALPLIKMLLFAAVTVELLKLEVALGFRRTMLVGLVSSMSATAEVDTGKPFEAPKSFKNQVVVCGTLILTATAQLTP
jgi:hypothetical protein